MVSIVCCEPSNRYLYYFPIVHLHRMFSTPEEIEGQRAMLFSPLKFFGE